MLAGTGLMWRWVLFSLALWLGASGPARAAWSVAVSQHFIVYSEEKPNELRAYVERLERFDSALRFLRRMDAPPVSRAGKLTLFVVGNAGGVQRLMGRGSSNVYGFYRPAAGRSFAAVPRRAGSGSDGELTAQQVLLHEYAHHFMYRNYAGAVPQWFSEGFAEFNGTARFEKDGGVGLGLPAQHRAYGLFEDSGLSLRRMLSGDYTKLDGMELETIYGKGWLLTHYLTLGGQRPGQLAAYLKAINAGATAAKAAEVFGDLKLLDRELDRYLGRSKMSYLKLGPDKLATRPVEVRALSAGASAVMPSKMRSFAGVNAKTAPQVAADMRRAAAPYRGDPFVERALAEAEYDLGNFDAADAAANAALAVEPANVEALFYKGHIAVARAVTAKATDAATWRAARAWFLKANAIENDHPEPLIAFYRAYEAQGIKPPANAAQALARAQDLAPEDEGLRVLLARQHLRDGKGDLARRVLAPVAYAPHGGARAAWVAGIIAAIDSGGPAAALKQWEAEPADEADAG